MQNDILPIFVVNDYAKISHSKLLLSLCDFNGTVLDSLVVDSLCIPDRGASEIAQYVLPKKLKINKLTHHYLLLQLYQNDGQLLAQKVYYYLYPKQLEFESKGIRTSVQRLNAGTQDEQYIFTLSADRIKYGVELATNISGRYSDNYFTLLPGEEKQITFTPSAPAKVQMVYSVKSFGKE
jgi:beta-mannosidase